MEKKYYVYDNIRQKLEILQNNVIDPREYYVDLNYYIKKTKKTFT